MTNHKVNNQSIRNIIISQKDFDLLPRDMDGVCIYIGDLVLSGCNLTTLPDNLRVHGWLDCDDNQLKELPVGLNIRSDFYCSHNQFTTIPDDLIVFNSMWCQGNIITKEVKADIGKLLMRKEHRVIYNRLVKLNRLKDKIDG